MQHAEELAFVFGKEPAPGLWTDAERAVANMVQNYWINFAASGDPNGPDVPPWQAYRGDGPVLWFADRRRQGRRRAETRGPEGDQRSRRGLVRGAPLR